MLFGCSSGIHFFAPRGNANCNFHDTLLHDASRLRRQLIVSTVVYQHSTITLSVVLCMRNVQYCV